MLYLKLHVSNICSNQALLYFGPPEINCRIVHYYPSHSRSVLLLFPKYFYCSSTYLLLNCISKKIIKNQKSVVLPCGSKLYKTNKNRGKNYVIVATVVECFIFCIFGIYISYMLNLGISLNINNFSGSYLLST